MGVILYYENLTAKSDDRWFSL